MRILAVLLLAIMPILSGCGVVQSVQPLSSPRAAVADKRIEGLWRFSDGKDSHGYYYISYAANGHGSVMMFGTDAKTGLAETKYDFFATPDGKDGFLNLNHETGTPSGFFVHNGDRYFFLQYHFDWLGRMVYRTVQGDAFGKAVDSHKLRGKATYDQSKKTYTDIELTDSSQHILSFIKSSKPDDVLGPPTKLTWVGGP